MCTNIRENDLIEIYNDETTADIEKNILKNLSNIGHHL